MFASLIIEKTQLEWAQVPTAFLSWVQDVGGLAALALAVFGLAYLRRRPEWIDDKWALTKQIVLFAASISVLSYAVFFSLLQLWGMISTPNPDPRQPPILSYHPAQAFFLTLAGACALFAALLPMVLDLLLRHLSGRRIWALARLSLKEAWRRGIVWICVAIPIIFLYADYYMSGQPQDQLRTRVGVAYFAMSLLFIVTAVLLGAFSIPNDIKNQTIHTIVTKPVQRYEIVLGRFLGYALLLLAEMVLLTTLSLIYVVRGITPEAEAESYHAREPLFGKQLLFFGTNLSNRGESVGREWDYRSYISGPGLQGAGGQEAQYAIWLFDHVPAGLAERTEPVRLEFTFDIFRTNKGIEGKGVYCTFTFASGQMSMPAIRKALKAIADERGNLSDKAGRKGEDQDSANQKLLEKYGVFQISGVEVTDYHTQSLEVPAGIFKKAQSDAKNSAPSDDKPAPVLQVLLNVDRTPGSSQQMIGVARRDLYFLTGDYPFWLNYVKGSLTIWLGACLVLGIAVICSTFLSGVIAFLATCSLCGLGLFKEFIRSLAEGRTEGGREGGLMGSMVRLLHRQNPNAPLEKTGGGYTLIVAFDDTYRWMLQRVLNVIPDVTQYNLATFVANGFDISPNQLFLDNLFPLIGYLVPCGILGYYLMKSREIANPT